MARFSPRILPSAEFLDYQLFALFRAHDIGGDAHTLQMGRTKLQIAFSIAESKNLIEGELLSHRYIPKIEGQLLLFFYFILTSTVCNNRVHSLTRKTVQ